jgi:hypothetical protein
VEKEEDAASQDHLLTSCISSIKEQEEVKANLENVIQSVNSKKEAQKRQLELTRQEKENLRSKQQDVDKDFAVEIPVNKVVPPPRRCLLVAQEPGSRQPARRRRAGPLCALPEHHQHPLGRGGAQRQGFRDPRRGRGALRAASDRPPW